MLTIAETGGGNVYVNGAGNGANATAATITGIADLINSGTGTLALTKAEGQVYTNISGGNLTVSNTGALNKVYVNAGGDSGNALSGMSGGNLTLNSNGAGLVGNTIKVTSFTAGTLTVNQSASMDGSLLTLSGGSATNAIINQNGSYLDATVHSVNGSTATYDLNEVGTSSAHTTLDLTI